MVLDELLFASAHFGVQLGERACMYKSVGKVTVLQVGQWPKLKPDFIGPTGTSGNFNPLAGFQNELPEAAVEMIKVPEMVEADSRPKTVGIPSHREREPIGGKPVVVVMLQNVKRECFVGNGESTRFQEFQLLLVSECWLAYFATPLRCSAQIKSNLPGAHRGEAWEVLLPTSMTLGVDCKNGWHCVTVIGNYYPCSLS